LVYNPKDKRYSKYEGKMFINPANGEELPLIGDMYVDKSFGTGVMKCTPAHDPNDFAIAKRHNLAMPLIMNPDGTMNEKCGKYKGMDRFACRDALVEQIEKDNRLQTAIDVVREQFGFLAIQKGTVLTEGSRNIERSKPAL
jgi:valyl-tRNA synthetase